MYKQDLEIAELQSLCRRTLIILEDEDFFDNTQDGEFWHSSLHRDLTKASRGDKLTTFEKMYKLAISVIKDLEKR